MAASYPSQMSNLSLKYRLPDLIALCPLQQESNPFFDEVSKESRAWSDSYLPLFFSPKHVAYFQQCDIQLLASYVFPFADRERFRTCCDVLTFILCIDEITDDYDETGVASLRNTVMKALNNPEEARTWEDKPISQMALDCWCRFTATAGPNNCRRFLEVFDDYLTCTTKEANLREIGLVVDPQNFVSLRRSNSATSISFSLIEYAYGFDLPNEVYEDSTFMKAYWSTLDMIIWSNDLFSYNAEQAKGHSGNNVLTVIMKARNVDLQSACDEVGVYFKSLVDEFLWAQKNVPSWSPSVDEDAARFMSACGTCLIGYMVWAFHSERYFGAQNRVVEKTLIDTVRPPVRPEDHMYKEMELLAPKA